VEYQRIRNRASWNRWDRAGMQRVACWRHRDFQKGQEQPANAPGTLILVDQCEQDPCGR